METIEQNAKQFLDENDAVKQLMELLYQQKMGEQTKDYVWQKQEKTLKGELFGRENVNARLTKGMFIPIQTHMENVEVFMQMIYQNSEKKNRSC